MSKAKFLEDAALVIDGRVMELEAELKLYESLDSEAIHLRGDRAAIAEAKHCARLIAHALNI